MSQRSQISVFMILGILLLVVAGVGSWFFFQERTDSPSLEVSKTVASSPRGSVENFLRSCARQAVEEKVLDVGRSGGFSDVLNDGLPSQQHYFVADGSVSFFLFGGESRIPSMDRVRSEVSSAVKEFVEECAVWSKIEDVQVVRNGSFVVESSFGDSGVSVSVSSDALFISGGKEFSISSVKVQAPYRLSLLLRKAQNLVLLLVRSGGSLDVTTFCKGLSSSDSLVNVYIDGSSSGKVHLVSFVDASPLSAGLPPLRLRFGVSGVSLYGGCQG